MHSHLFKAVALALLIATTAKAAPPVPEHGVVADLVVAKVAKRADGHQKFISARGTEPGDVVEYRVTYRNTTYGAARGVVGTLTIPVHRLSYIPESASHGLMLEASVDGRTFEPVPLKRLVVRENGQLKMEPIPASEYRFLRWQIGDLPARGSMTVSARMRVHEPQVVLVTNSVR
jgi:hypothetical protein